MRCPLCGQPIEWHDAARCRQARRELAAVAGRTLREMAVEAQVNRRLDEIVARAARETQR